MTEKLKQSLSAAMDDEADAFELRRVLDELGRDAELRSLWDRYHLIGSAVRGDRLRVSPDLRDRVWAALEEAPEVVAQAPGAVQEVRSEAASAPSAAATPSKAGRYTGLAVAASVAFAVVLGFSGMWDSGDAGIPGLADTGAAVAPAGAAGALPDAAPRLDLQTEVSASDVQRSQAYMLHHAQQQALNQAGVMSFVKLATYEAP